MEMIIFIHYFELLVNVNS